MLPVIIKTLDKIMESKCMLYICHLYTPVYPQAMKISENSNASYYDSNHAVEKINVLL